MPLTGALKFEPEDGQGRIESAAPLPDKAGNVAAAIWSASAAARQHPPSGQKAVIN
jgi:hypothetical protein